MMISSEQRYFIPRYFGFFGNYERLYICRLELSVDSIMVGTYNYINHIIDSKYWTWNINTLFVSEGYAKHKPDDIFIPR